MRKDTLLCRLSSSFLICSVQWCNCWYIAIKQMVLLSPVEMSCESKMPDSWRDRMQESTSSRPVVSSSSISFCPSTSNPRQRLCTISESSRVFWSHWICSPVLGFCMPPANPTWYWPSLPSKYHWHIKLYTPGDWYLLNSEKILDVFQFKMVMVMP